MQFVYQPLTWGFFLVLVPLLIHLINLMRHRRVQWAAMEFLLQSYKKHRRWVWLKQMLLLLARMLAVAAVVAMLAQLVTNRQWTSFFGGKTTHHIVLLDDSYSMSDRVGGTTAFDRGMQAIRQIGARASSPEAGPQRFTLIRYSQATRAVESIALSEPVVETDVGNEEVSPLASVAGQIADLNAVLIDADFDTLIGEKRRAFDVTQLAVGPNAALQLAAQLVAQAEGQQPVVYVVSDFRTDSWQQPEESRQGLERLTELDTELHLVRCVDVARPNLAITGLEPAEGTRAAGVPLFVDVTVKNFGREAAEQVQLNVRTNYYPAISSTDDPGNVKDTVDELPTVLIDRIAAGEAIVRRVQVYFPTAGQHIVTAQLPEDSVPVDNQRWCVVDFPADVPVLLVDGDPNQRNAYYLDSIFQPGTRAKTGIRPSVQSPGFLRDVSIEGLLGFQVVYLLDVDRLDDRAVENLNQYVREGGGVAMFLGPNSNIAFYNQWYDDARGLFPVPLDRQDVVAHRDEAPDMTVVDHPLFRVLLGQRNPFLQDIGIDQYVRAPIGWDRPEASTIRVLAQLTNGQPLVAERRYGEGRVVAFLTTLSPTWNNWARLPSFIVVALELQAYLDSVQMGAAPRLVGTPIDLELSVSDFRPETRFVLPSVNSSQPRVLQRTASPYGGEDAKLMMVSLGRAATQLGGVGETDRSGVYEAWPQRLDAQSDVRRYSLNVDTRESDLAIVDSTQLADELNGIAIEIHQPDEISYATSDSSSFSWSQLLLFGLIGLLLGEQLLAYSASYHPARGGNK